jgi:hypothetical protein
VGEGWCRPVGEMGRNGGQQISERNGLSVRKRVLPGGCWSEKMEMCRGRRLSRDDGLLGHR